MVVMIMMMLVLVVVNDKTFLSINGMRDIWRQLAHARQKKQTCSCRGFICDYSAKRGRLSVYSILIVA